MKYVSIDIETTGLDWETCDVIEIGAVIDDFETPIEKLATFRCYIDHGIFRGQPYALSMHAEIFRAIATGDTNVDIIDQLHVADHFAIWLSKNGIIPCSKFVVAGKNFAAFDKNFLDCLPNWELEICMKHRFIDPGNMYYVPGVDDEPPNMEECLRCAGLPTDVSHKALDDAFDVVKLIRWKMNKSEDCDMRADGRVSDSYDSSNQ